MNPVWSAIQTTPTSRGDDTGTKHRPSKTESMFVVPTILLIVMAISAGVIVALVAREVSRR